jgi:GGDEF domain-containing protein
MSPQLHPQPHENSPEVHSMVHSYLATLLALSDALEAACPPVGGPHQQRLGRLRTRLSFDSNKEAIEASSNVVRAELQDFAAKSFEYVTLTTGEWKSAAEEIRNLGAGLIKRQRFYATRLREMAAKLDPEQATPLNSCAESMDNDAQSMLSRMQDILAGVETRLAAAEVVDPATGLMNRRELDRRIQRQRADGELGIRLLFRVSYETAPPSPDAVLRQIAVRLTAQLRPEDLIGRWSESEFLVLFRASSDIAERRGAEVAEMLHGSYTSDGVSVEVRAAVTVLDRVLAPVVA